MSCDVDSARLLPDLEMFHLLIHFTLMSLPSGFGLKSLIDFDSKISPFLRSITTVDKLNKPNTLSQLEPFKPNFFIVNTSPSTSSAVGHWVGILWVGSSEDPSSSDLFAFLDPLAEEYYTYGEELESFVRTLGDPSELVSLPFQIQASSSTYCGLFVIYLIHKLLGERKSFAEILDNFSTTDLSGNQRVVKNWGKAFFGPGLLSSLENPLYSDN